MPITSTQRQNVDLVKRFNSEVFNGRDFQRLPELVAEDVVQHGPLSGETVRGIDALEEMLHRYQDGLSDLEATIEEQFATDDVVVTYYTYSATHDGDFMSIPASGESVRVNGIVINLIDDGKMVETWACVDFASLLGQVGVLDLPEN